MQLREHYHSHWHRINLKRIGKGKAPLDEDAAKGVKSSSEEEEDEEEEEEEEEEDDGNIDGQNRFSGRVKINVGNKDVHVWRVLLSRKDERPAIEVVRERQNSDFRWMVLLLSGSGRFAAGVFERDTLLCHKTFARYVTRRKQGGAQSKHDQKNGKAHSVGAQLRRHNESLLKWEIFSLLTEWKHFIASMNLIFISSSPRHIGVFFNGQKGKSSVLQKSDARLRSVPFSTNDLHYRKCCMCKIGGNSPADNHF